MKTYNDNKSARVEEIYEQYSKMMYHLAFAYLQDKDLAMDIVQDTILVVWERLDYIEHHQLAEEYFTQRFIATVTKYKAVSYIRKQRQLCPIDRYEQEIISSNAEYWYDFSESALLKGLDKEEVEIIILRYQYDFTYKEIADALVITESTARKRIERILKKLRKEFTLHDAIQWT